ncbi:DegT/DnrJ/EryC1/StrS family aminotransferase [Agromyces sp. NPDC058136]|uniref:DegT/DnrJ/EryC1/StrS family aminotransferase n=1 Tax=Agromyces sp. NPDC058136 TaxID=3346354 RepID=UPI0036DC2511
MRSQQVPFNDLSRGMSRDRESFLEAAAAVLDSGYAIHGSQHAAFEAELADYLGAGAAVGVASGTDALELAIKAVMPADRDTVITAANAGAYTSTATVRAGFVPRYADVDPTSLCLTAETVLDRLTDHVGVVVVTHLYGFLGDAAALRELCDERGIALVEDCAQAIGASRAGRFAGTFGHAATASFYPTKNLGAVGDGGAVITETAITADRVRRLRQYGWESKYLATLSGGTNSRLDELQAAFLRIRLRSLDEQNARRREILERYRAAAADLDPQLLTVLPATDSGHIAHLAIARSARRDQVRASLGAAGVPTDVHFPHPDWEQPAFERFAPDVDLPATVAACAEVLSLPLFPELTDDEVDAVCAAIGALA